MWTTWGPPGSCRPQVGPMLAPWTLLSGPRARSCRDTCPFKSFRNPTSSIALITHGGLRTVRHLKHSQTLWGHLDGVLRFPSQGHFWCRVSIYTWKNTTLWFMGSVPIIGQHFADTFQCILNKKIMYFYQNFTWVCSLRSHWQFVTIDSGIRFQRVEKLHPIYTLLKNYCIVK